ncbi:MAG: Flp pilus assembly complex ATPase component TadA [Candidatus Omnitrophica bacterium]|nr:Flp pilus assembly complex ATPase component TadA [Candidatus Omnitrophota bacterium]
MAKIIVLFSTKGGVGKTLISGNLAFSIAQAKKKVLLVDGDLDVVGDMARMINLEQGKSLVDIMYLLKNDKEVIVSEFMSRRDSVDFIPAVTKVRQVSQFEPDLIKRIFNLFKENYDYIVVDGGRVFTESLIRFFDEANLLLLMVTPDILAVYQTKWALDTLQSLFFPLEMVRIIMNRAGSLASISMSELKSSLPCEIILKIPSEGEIAMLSVNKKTPLVKEFPKSRITYVLKEFVRDVLSKEESFLKRKEIEEIRTDIRKYRESFSEKKVTVFENASEEQHSFEERKEEDEMVTLKQRLHKRLIDELNLRRLEVKIFSDHNKMRALKKKAEKLLGGFLVEETHSLVSSQEVREKLIKEMIDEALGLGPLEDFLNDPLVTDIMVNNKEEIYVEENGKIKLTSKRFVSNEQVKTVIERIIAPIGRHIDESIPMVDARLPDGSRVNAIIPPLSLTGPTLTIRKFRKEKFKVKELVDLGALNLGMGSFLEACVLARKNMIVSGGTGSGKTTVLNILSSFILSDERIITLEDAAELKLDQAHWVRLESRSANIEGKGQVTIKDLFRNTLRMRPDRIVVGECRGAETLDMLQAMNTGHDGSMTTLHANSTHDVLVRLDSMVLMSGIGLPIRALREMIASAVDLIVHTARLSDGSRKIIQITELTELYDEMHIGLKDIFTFRQKGIDSEKRVIGDFKPTGYIPTFFEDMRIRGINISKDIFQP